MSAANLTDAFQKVLVRLTVQNMSLEGNFVHSQPLQHCKPDWLEGNVAFVEKLYLDYQMLYVTYHSVPYQRTTVLCDGLCMQAVQRCTIKSNMFQIEFMNVSLAAQGLCCAAPDFFFQQTGSSYRIQTIDHFCCKSKFSCAYSQKLVESGIGSAWSNYDGSCLELLAVFKNLSTHL